MPSVGATNGPMDDNANDAKATKGIPNELGEPAGTRDKLHPSVTDATTGRLLGRETWEYRTRP